MALISLAEAATRTGIPRPTIEAWTAQGLLTIHASAGEVAPQGSSFIDEEEFERVVESIGWLHLSSEGWDSTEEEE
jgi:hypothetical protein